MGAPNITGVTTGAVTEGSGLVISGNLDDSNPWFSNDNWSIISGASYGTATVDPATGVWSYDLDDSHPAVKALDAGDTLTDTFTVRLTDGGGSDTQVVTITITGVPCFTPGTLIDTPAGPRRVETIGIGDLVVTRDRGPQPVRWVGRQTVAARGEMAPVRVAAGTLGNRRDLVVSPQHRMLIGGWQAQLLFGLDEVLVAAAHLVDGDRIRRMPGGMVTYLHLMFDAHELIFAEGAPCESFFAGGDVAAGMAAVHEELGRLFPELGPAGFRTALPCLDGFEARLIHPARMGGGA